MTSYPCVYRQQSFFLKCMLMSLYSCVCVVFVGMCIWRCMLSVCIEARGDHWESCSVSLSVSWTLETGSITEPGARLMTSKTQIPPSFHLPQPWCYRHMDKHAGLFMSVLEIWTQVFMLRQYSHWLSHDLTHWLSHLPRHFVYLFWRSASAPNLPRLLNRSICKLKKKVW